MSITKAQLITSDDERQLAGPAPRSLLSEQGISVSGQDLSLREQDSSVAGGSQRHREDSISISTSPMDAERIISPGGSLKQLTDLVTMPPTNAQGILAPGMSLKHLAGLATMPPKNSRKISESDESLTATSSGSETPRLTVIARGAMALGSNIARVARNIILTQFAIQHIFMITIAFSIIILSILTAGCTTPALKDIYLLSLSYQPAPAPSLSASQLNPALSATFAELAGNATTLQVRTGYIGMCISAVPGSWTCSRDADSLARALNSTQGATNPDPLNILWVAKTFRDNIVFEGLIFASIALMIIGFLLLATFPGWHTEEDDEGSEVEVKPFPSRPVSWTASSAIFIAAILVLVSVLWQHVATAAAASMGGSLAYDAVRGRVGIASILLGWGGVLLVIVAMLGVFIYISSIRDLQRMVN